MTDIAALGVKVTSDGVVKTTNDLTKFAEAAAKAGQVKPIAVKISTAGTAKALAEVERLRAAMGSGGAFNLSTTSAVAEVNRLTAATTALAAAQSAAAAANERVAMTNARVATTSTQAATATGQWANGGTVWVANAKKIEDAGNGVTKMAGAQRQGLQQLGYQLGDVATMYSLGAKPGQIFASQIGQITQAVQLMSGGTSKLAAFLGGPWGVALSVAVIALAPFIGKLFEAKGALDDVGKAATDAMAKLTASLNQASAVSGAATANVELLVTAQAKLAQANRRIAEIEGSQNKSQGFALIQAQQQRAKAIKDIETAQTNLNQVSQTSATVIAMQQRNQERLNGTDAASVAQKKALRDAQRAANKENREAESAAKRAAREAQQDFDQRARAAQSFSERLEEQAAKFGMTAVEAMRYEAAMEAAKAPTEELKNRILDAADALAVLMNSQQGRDFNDSIREIDQAREMVGLYGKQLMAATIYKQEFNRATDNGRKPIDEWGKAILRAGAAMKAEKQFALERAQWLEEAARRSEQMAAGLERERSELGLTGAALAAYRIETDMLADAVAKFGPDGVDEAMREGIRQTAAELGKAQNAVDSLRESLGALNSVMGQGLGGLLGALTDRNPIASLIGMGGLGTVVGLGTNMGQNAYREQANIIAGSLKDVFGVSGPFAKTLAGALQGSGLGQIGSALTGGSSTGGAIGGALGGALMSGGLGKSITKGLTGALGSALGGALSAAIPVLGGMLGGLVGGLFKKDKYGTATVVGGVGFGTSGNNADARSGAGSLATSLQSALANMAKGLNTTLGQFAVSIGVTNGNINVNPGQVTGMIGTTKQRNTIDFLQDEAGALRWAIKDAISDGALQGLSEGWKQFLLKSDDIEGAFGRLQNLQGAYNELSQMKDPQGYALSELDKAFAELRATATAAGDDLVRIEELYGLKRAEILEEYSTNNLELERTRRSMEAELLRLTGDELGATAIVRQLEREQLDASLHSLYDQIAALQDQAAATERAASAAREYAAQQQATGDKLISLRERLLQAQGDETGLRDLQRAIEYEKATAGEREFLDAIYKAEDAARAAAEQAARMAEAQRKADEQARAAAEAARAAAELAARKFDMENELLRLQGKEAQAIARERKAQLASIDPSLKALQEMIWAEQDLAKIREAAAQKVEDARSALSQAYEREAGALNDTIDRFKGLRGTLSDFRDSLMATTYADSFASLQARLMRVSAEANLGGEDALKSLPGVAQDFLSAARDRAVSRSQFQLQNAMVARIIEQGMGAADEAIDYNQLQLDALDRSVDGLIDIKDAIEKSVAELKAELVKAIKESDENRKAENLAIVKNTGVSAAKAEYDMRNPANV